MVNGSDPETTDHDRILCHTCKAEIPLSEAVSAEADDYMLHFCGMECLDTWYKQAGKEGYLPEDKQ